MYDTVLMKLPVDPIISGQFNEDGPKWTLFMSLKFCFHYSPKVSGLFPKSLIKYENLVYVQMIQVVKKGVE